MTAPAPTLADLAERPEHPRDALLAMSRCFWWSLIVSVPVWVVVFHAVRWGLRLWCAPT